MIDITHGGDFRESTPLPGLGLLMRGDQCLPQAKPAVAGGNVMMRKHLKSTVLQAFFETLLQVHVLERSAAQAHAFQVGSLPHQLRYLG